MDRILAVKAPAKLNLALSVGPPDDDGMHPVCTWMVTIDLFDELQVTRLPEDRLSRYAVLWHDEAPRTSEIDWSLARDLAVRAHLALEQYAERRLPLQMKLEKRIPVGAGLGGGSSDAAAMLRATNRLFDLGLSECELREIAAGLGSDVPFFVTGGSAVVEGFGERIETHGGVPQIHAVLVFPEAACPTGQVYAAYDELGPAALRADEVRALAASNGPPRVFNDLAAAALHVVPALAGPLYELSRLAKCRAEVAGSGSSLFVVCDDELHAGHLAGAAGKRLGLPAVAVRATAVPEPAPA